MIALALAWSCTAPDPRDSSGGDTDLLDTDGDTDTGNGIDTDVDWDGLHGDVPDETIPAPTFSATNRDDTPRDRDDLLGHATVMWFYVWAGTSG
jgi:hypothetical protein